MKIYELIRSPQRNRVVGPLIGDIRKCFKMRAWYLRWLPEVYTGYAQIINGNVVAYIPKDSVIFVLEAA
jgi:hypothetical protein